MSKYPVHCFSLRDIHAICNRFPYLSVLSTSLNNSYICLMPRPSSRCFVSPSGRSGQNIHDCEVVPNPPPPPPPPPPPWLLGSHICSCLQQKHAEHHDSIVYSKHEPILTFLAGASSDLTFGNTTQEPLDLPA